MNFELKTIALIAGCVVGAAVVITGGYKLGKRMLSKKHEETNATVSESASANAATASAS